MKDDHTYDGIPISQMHTADIASCLRNGIKINSTVGYFGSIQQAEEDVVKRLQIELTIRLYNLRS